MMREELKELVSEMQNICDLLSTEEDVLDNLRRLTFCIAKLKSYPLCSQKVDEVLDEIEDYVQNTSSIDEVIFITQELIYELNEFLEIEPVFSSFKKGYEEVKDMINEAIPEFKDACKEKVDQVISVGRGAEKKLKSALRNWLLSDDDE